MIIPLPQKHGTIKNAVTGAVKMKISWWQGGLHYEPENSSDRDALMSIWNAQRVIPAKSEAGNCSTASSSVFLEQVGNGVVVRE